MFLGADQGRGEEQKNKNTIIEITSICQSSIKKTNRNCIIYPINDMQSLVYKNIRSNKNKKKRTSLIWF